MDAYLKTLDRMEKDIAAVDLTAAAASISISLKRIADALEMIELKNLNGFFPICPGHVGHPKDLNVCRYCGTHVNDERSD
jgi:hypothetical protein